MLTIGLQDRVTCTKVASRVFRFKTTNTFLWVAGTWNEMLCVPRWLLAQKIGVGVRFGDGCKVQSLNRSCYPHGPYRVSQIGLIESMNLLPTVSSKVSATALSAEHHLEMKDGSNPSHEDWTSNQQCDRAGDHFKWLINACGMAIIHLDQDKYLVLAQD